MNKKQCTAFIISGFCLSSYADQNVGVQKQSSTTTKSVEATNNSGFKGKVKVVNGYEVAGNSEKGKKIKDEFLAKKAEAEKELQTRQAELIAANKEFTAKAPTLNEKARRDEEKKIARLDQELKVKAQELKEDLESHMYRRTEELGQEFEKEVQKYGKKEDLDLVIDQSSGRPVYVADRLQCTNDIVALMNKADDKNKKIATSTASKSNTTTASKKTV